jgi:hypothetical protein
MRLGTGNRARLSALTGRRHSADQGIARARLSPPGRDRGRSGIYAAATRSMGDTDATNKERLEGGRRADEPGDRRGTVHQPRASLPLAGALVLRSGSFGARARLNPQAPVAAGRRRWKAYVQSWLSGKIWTQSSCR